MPDCLLRCYTSHQVPSAVGLTRPPLEAPSHPLSETFASITYHGYQSLLSMHAVVANLHVNGLTITNPFVKDCSHTSSQRVNGATILPQYQRVKEGKTGLDLLSRDITVTWLAGYLPTWHLQQ